jgi:hypothetical protein
MVQRNHNKGKGKPKSNKPNKTINFKKKKNKAELTCSACGETGHFAKNCPDRADCHGKQGNVNTVIASNEEDKGYDNLPFIFSVFQSPSWWLDTGANVHVCSDINLFSSYQGARDCSVLMGNGSHASVHGTDTVDLKFTSEKIVQHVPSIHKNLVSGTLLCRDGFKVVLESNKLVVSKYGQFIGKVYDCGGLFRFSLIEFNNKSVNHICANVDDLASIWHSRLCHINFGSLSRLSTMSLIPNITIVKGSKCHSCVQSKQPRKSHKAAEERHLAPLELIHSDLCEMNGVLTKGGKRYFMILIDDASRFLLCILSKN